MGALIRVIGGGGLLLVAGGLYVRFGAPIEVGPASPTDASARTKHASRSPSIDEHGAWNRSGADPHFDRGGMDGGHGHLDAAPPSSANRRAVPTAAARSKQLVENATKDLQEDTGDEDPTEMEALRTTLFNDPDPDERLSAVFTLSNDEGPDSLRMLVEAMDDPNPEVRLAVIEALGDRSDELSPDTLAKAANDSDSEIRSEVADILDEMK
ncbi:MAG: HEAT repeat domain-containing protein [Thermoanaerobaculia bacterium]